jgi:hypothetical protein
MPKGQTVSQERLAELSLGLERIDAAWTAWDRELVEAQQRLEQAGMDRLEAADVVHRQQMEALRSGTGPVAFEELHALLDEFLSLYLEADEDQRLLIRNSFEDKKRLRKYLHSYVGGRAAPLLRSTGEARWLRLGLAAASIVDQRVDYRDLLICLVELWLAAEEAGIAPARYFSGVARISSDEPVYGNRPTRELLRRFRTSAFLKSIKRQDRESRE